jgi:hypothetical protein
MGWKLLGLMNVLIVMVAIFGPGSSYGVLGLLAVTMAIPAAAGVFLYAYERPVEPRFWRVFSWLFAVDSVGIVTFFVIRSIEIGPHHNAVLVASFLIFMISCQYLTWLAIYRLGQDLPRPIAQSTAKGQRFGRLIAESADQTPRQVGIGTWCVMLALFTTAPLVIWYQISEGKISKLILPAVFGLAIGLRSYMVAKKARGGS